MENELVAAKQSTIHGNGVFAKKDIEKGTIIIEYVGTKLTKKQADLVQDSRYLFSINKRYDIDGNVSYNTARFINHSCSPNCETENTKSRIFIRATKNIKKGEELSYNYGYDLEDYQDWPCKCGAKNCVRFILAEEYWSKLYKLVDNPQGLEEL